MILFSFKQCKKKKNNQCDSVSNISTSWFVKSITRNKSKTEYLKHSLVLVNLQKKNYKKFSDTVYSAMRQWIVFLVHPKTLGVYHASQKIIQYLNIVYAEYFPECSLWNISAPKCEGTHVLGIKKNCFQTIIVNALIVATNILCNVNYLISSNMKGIGGHF